MRTNQEYKNAALALLRGNWTAPVVATLVYVVIALLITGSTEIPGIIKADTGLSLWLGGAMSLLCILIVNPLSVGYVNGMRLLYERKDRDCLNNMVKIGTTNYLHKVLGMFLMGLKVLLWSLLLIVPGIIMTFAYALTPYILEEHPEIGAWDASARSREMMKGHKFDLFYLYLSFIGWFFLAILTFGIGFLWLSPYVDTAVAAFYNDLKAQRAKRP